MKQRLIKIVAAMVVYHNCLVMVMLLSFYWFSSLYSTIAATILMIRCFTFLLF